MSVTMFKCARNQTEFKPCADVAKRIISNATNTGLRAYKPTAMAVAMVNAAVEATTAKQA